MLLTLTLTPSSCAPTGSLYQAGSTLPLDYISSCCFCFCFWVVVLFIDLGGPIWICSVAHAVRELNIILSLPLSCLYLKLHLFFFFHYFPFFCLSVSFSFLSFLFIFIFFETGSSLCNLASFGAYYVNQASFQFTKLHLSPKCWD